MATYFNGNGGGGNDSLSWLSFILGSIDKTKETNRESKDAATLSEWQKSGMQGTQPNFLSERYRSAFLPVAAAQSQESWRAGLRNEDIAAIEGLWRNMNQPQMNHYLSDNSSPQGLDVLGPQPMMRQQQAPFGTPFPNMQSGDIGPQAQSDYVSSVLSNTLPMSPLQQAQLEHTQAQTQAMMAKPLPDQQLWARKSTGEGPSYRYLQKGQVPNEPGWEPVNPSSQTINNIMGGGNKITQATQTKIEEQVVSDSAFAKSLSDLSGGFKSEYFEYGPIIQSWLYNNLTGKVQSLRDAVPNKDQQFYADMEAFKSQANQVFNEYRKVITGAQAGMPEIQFLRKSVPTTNDSPEVFKAKSKVAQEFFERRAQLYQEALASDSPLKVIAGLDTRVAKEIAGKIQAGGYGQVIQQAVGVGLKPITQMSIGEQIAELRSRGASVQEIQAALKEEADKNANSR